MVKVLVNAADITRCTAIFKNLYVTIQVTQLVKRFNCTITIFYSYQGTVSTIAHCNCFD